MQKTKINEGISKDIDSEIYELWFRIIMLSYSSLSKTRLCYKTYRSFTTSKYLNKKLPPNKNPFNKKKPGWILNMFNTIKNPTKGLGVIWYDKKFKVLNVCLKSLLKI